MKKITLAIVDNYPVVREALDLAFRKMGFDVALKVSYSETTVAALADHTLNACCLNVTSSEALDVALHIKTILPEIKIIGYALDNRPINNTAPGIDLFLFKSLSKKKIKQSVERLCLDVIDSCLVLEKVYTEKV